MDNLVDKKTTRRCRFLFANRVGFWEIRSWKFCGTSSQRAPNDAEAVTGAAATSASPIRVVKRRAELCASKDPSGLSSSQSRKGAAVIETGRGDPTVEVRPQREIGVARRWKAPRVRRSARAFASAGRRRPSGVSVVAFGRRQVRWATSSPIDASAKAVARGFWERFSARGSGPPNGRQCGLVPSSGRHEEATRGVRTGFRSG